MPHLSPLYRFLTVLYAVFGFGRICFRFCGFGSSFSSVLRFLIDPNAPAPLKLIHLDVSKLPVQSSGSLHQNKKSKMADNNDKSQQNCYICRSFSELNSATKGNHGLEGERKVWSDNWENSSFAFRKFSKLLAWQRDGPEIYQRNRELIQR